MIFPPPCATRSAPPPPPPPRAPRPPHRRTGTPARRSRRRPPPQRRVPARPVGRLLEGDLDPLGGEQLDEPRAHLLALMGRVPGDHAGVQRRAEAGVVGR